MKVGTLVRIIADILPILERDRIIDANDDFHEPTPQQWVAMATEVEEVLKSHGVEVQAEVDKLIHLLPLVFSLIGIR